MKPMLNTSASMQTLSDRLWETDQARQARFIAAEDAARLLASQADEIRAGYSFLLAEDLCFFKADETPVQAAMAVIGDEDAVVVICCYETGEAVWTVQMRPTSPFPAAAYIQAVQARVEANKAARH